MSKPFFNPTLAEKVQITVRVPAAGSLTLQVIDRDGYVTRTLATNQPVQPGTTSFDWDGRNDREIVPDEAYSFRAELVSGSVKQLYFPANAISKDVEPKVAYYDRQTGTLSYKLSKPARVHAQAGVAKIDPVTKKPNGPVLKTIVNREPRSGAGTIAEHWDGFAEDGFTYVPDLADFVVAVASTALPEHSVITIGNRSKTFLETISNRKGTSLFTFSVKDHRHHRGLTALEDISPNLKLQPLNASWGSSEHAWTVTTQEPLRLTCTVEGQTADAFIKQRGSLLVFVDGRLIHQQKPESVSLTIEIPTEKFSAGIHLLAVNWGTEAGPASANLIRIKIENVASAKEGVKR